MLVDVPTSIVKTSDALVGALDCWDNSEKCVVCGNGGCFTFQYNAAGAYTFLKHYYHKKYFFTNAAGAKVYDFVYDAKVLRLTNYFFTIESMKGTDSAGLMRWDSEASNCYVRYTGNFDDKGREFYLEPIRFTKNILLSSPGNNSLYVFSVNDITAPQKSITFGTGTADPVVGKIAAFTKQVERHLLISCSNKTTNQCFILDYNQTAAAALKMTVNLDGIAATDVDAIAKINVTVYPQSDWVAITVNDKILLYYYPGGTAATQNAAIATRLDGTPNTITTLGSMHTVQTGFHYADLFVANNLQILSLKLQDDNASNTNRCNENCRKGSDTNVQCDTDNFQAAGCNTGQCVTGAVANGTMICYVTPTVAPAVGGLALDFS